MPCPTITDPGCYINQAIGSVGQATGGNVLATIATGIRSALTWMFTNTATLWLKIGSPDLTAQASELAKVHQWLSPVTAAVAVGGAIAAGARMALTRKHGPLLDVTGGLAVIGLTAALGLVLPTVLMRAGDEWTGWVLSVSTGGDFPRRLDLLLASGYGAGIPDIVVIIFGAIAMVTSGLQAALLLFRQAAVLVLAGVLPLAAAGAIAPATRGWIKKTAGWMLALICYKPAAAAVYATAFTMIGNGTGLRALLTGFTMIVLSVVALPVLIRFFTWTTGAVASGGGGGAGQFLGLAAAGALGLGALRGGGTTAAQQAGSMNANSAPPGDGGPGGAGPSGPSGPEGPGGAPGAGDAGADSARAPAPGTSSPGGELGGSTRTRETSGPAAPGRAQDGGSPGSDSRASARGAARGDSRQGPDGATGAAPSGPGTRPSAFSPARGAGAAAAAPPAAATFAAFAAAQAMASGARTAASAPMEQEN